MCKVKHTFFMARVEIRVAYSQSLIFGNIRIFRKNVKETFFYENMSYMCVSTKRMEKF